MSSLLSRRSKLRTRITACCPLPQANPDVASVNENENSAAWSAMHTQLYTPIQLTRYGGNWHDVDPKYADSPSIFLPGFPRRL